VIAAFALALLLQSPVARLQIIVPMPDRDTANHVDLKVGSSAALLVRAFDARGSRLASPVVKWSSSNSAVVSVSSAGVVAGRKRGYGTITAAAGTVKASIRGCVAATDREELAWREVSRIVIPGQSLLYQGSTLQHEQDVQLAVTGQTAWGECVHWTVDRIAGVYYQATISRSGLLRASRSVGDIKAYIGPAVP